MSNLEQLVNSVHDLCWYYARRYYHAYYSVQLIGEIEDVAQEAFVGALEAAQNYQPELGYSFATFAAPRVRGAILDAARRVGLVVVKRAGQEAGQEPINVVNLDRVIAAEANPRLRLKRRSSEPVAPEDEGPLSADLQDALDRFMRDLNVRDRIVVNRYFGLDGRVPAEMKEIGKLIGVSESRVSQLLKKILTDESASAAFRGIHRRQLALAVAAA